MVNLVKVEMVLIQLLQTTLTIFQPVVPVVVLVGTVVAVLLLTMVVVVDHHTLDHQS
jgi:hypothetical protein